MPWFRLHTFPVAQQVARRWRTLSGISSGASAAGSITVLTKQVHHLLPAKLIDENLVYISLAFAFITALPLRVSQVVISLSLAQLGFTTSLMYLAYSLHGAFPPNYLPALRAVVVVVALAFSIIFLRGVRFFLRPQNRSISDFWLAVVILVVFICLWLFPLYYIK